MANYSRPTVTFPSAEQRQPLGAQQIVLLVWEEFAVAVPGRVVSETETRCNRPCPDQSILRVKPAYTTVYPRYILA